MGDSGSKGSSFFEWNPFLLVDAPPREPAWGWVAADFAADALGRNEPPVNFAEVALAFRHLAAPRGRGCTRGYGSSWNAHASYPL